MNSEDMSDVFEKLNNIAGQNNVSPDMVNNLFNMLNNSNASNNANSSSDSSNSNDSQSSENNTSGIDIETIMRMKTIMDKMNAKDDPRANLLQCLIPYLKEIFCTSSPDVASTEVTYSFDIKNPARSPAVTITP